ncbi:MAG: hypothetical protein OEX81_04495 [Candidatus Pacebacteria bacterium]|nr:hypothetical protein [Candidatus Paceibacterota bacterium]
MSELSFSQYQEIMKPFIDLIYGIVNIIGYDNKEKEKETADILVNQIFLSVMVMHLSQSSKGKMTPDSDELNKMIKDGKSEEVLSIFAKGITLDKLNKYLEESATMVMTNYYFEVKDQITPEKTESIKNLYQEIQERS